ncbi:hypothetical protein LDENG_00275470 [Lucifuga dentata]|nr:hypothetical protein LDENG_00275470 [Lucifuga dentata]
MGNCCCPPAGPCGTVEERSGLLRDDSKPLVPIAEMAAVGVCQNSPDADDDMKKATDETSMKAEEEEKEEKKEEAVQVKQSAEDVETKACTAQENGPLQQMETIETPTVSPSREPELRENSEKTTTAQEEEDDDEQETAADSKRAEPLQCTLVSLQTEHAAADQELFVAANVVPEGHPASAQAKIPEAAYPENASCTETDVLSDHLTAGVAQGDGRAAVCGSEVVENAVVEPSGEISLSLPNAELSAAVCQAPSASVANQDTESPSRIVPKQTVLENGSSSVCKEAVKSADVSETSGGSEPTGPGQSGVEGDSAAPATTDPAETSPSKKSDQDPKPDPEPAAISLKEAAALENIVQDTEEEKTLEEQNKDRDDSTLKEEETEKTPTEVLTNAEKEAKIQEPNGKEEMPASADVENDVKPVKEKEESAEHQLKNSEEDLYRGVEELSASRLQVTLPKVEDRCSLDPAVDILSYSEREWKGNTAKSVLIRKGYKEMSQRFGSLRRVRGDNYCALRAALFQLFSTSTALPAWLQQEDVATLPEELETREGLISQWVFPPECQQGDGTGDATQQLKGYVELLRNTWQEAVCCSSAVERQQLCDHVFQGGEEELGLLEALKLLMLSRAVELHGCMQGGGDVPLFCWLLFARDSSGCPRSFLSNHLSHVGLSAGLEQVEMFLLGYTLQCTIQVYRLYMADTEEFITYYPDDHKEDWLCVCLVTEDDRHYNVPVAEAAESPEELDSS